MERSFSLYLIRHPRVALPPGICYGQSDVALAEPPDEAARRLAALLPPDCRMVSSPLARCRALAACLSGSVALEPRLMEMNFGAWEMRRYDDIPRPALDEWAADPLGFRPPGGETGREVAERVWQACRDWTDRHGGPLAFICHGGPLRVLVGQLLGEPEQVWLNRDFAFGGCSLLRLRGPEARLEWCNR